LEDVQFGCGCQHRQFPAHQPWRPPSLILEADPPLHAGGSTIMNYRQKPMAGLRARVENGAD
jgi:hypothetical protein